MKPSDYIPNESEQFDAIHAFVCASVAACFATIYPRANPEKFRELVARVARPEAPACTEEGYCTRNGCDCPCCEAAHARLRAESFARACCSPASIHCASTEADRRHYHADPNYCKHCDDEALLAARLLATDTSRLPKEAIRAAAKVGHENPDAGPDGCL